MATTNNFTEDTGEKELVPQLPGTTPSDDYLKETGVSDDVGTKSTVLPDGPLPGTIGDGTENSAELPIEPPVEQPVPQGKDYSVLTDGQKKAVVLTASLASLFSPMATAIYYPSLTVIASDLGVSNSKVNITITVFLIIQGIAPAFIADMADRSGRRPMYLLCFIVMTGANIGLALQNDYAALLVLRMLQAAGSSGTVTLANGVVGDIVTSSERGKYMAFSSLGGMFGPMIAPVLGGIIGQFAGWHWIFWFIVIFSSAVFIPLLLFLPETCRRVVDDGTIPPPYLSKNITDSIRHKRRAKLGLVVDEENRKKLHEKNKFRFPNPFAAVKVLLNPESAVLLIATGLGLGCFYAISTGASDAFHKLFNFNQLQISLLFIPIGAGGIVSAFTTGKLVDWNYQRHARRLGVPIVRNRAQDLSNFPIERARLEVAFPMFFVGGAFVIMYGWFLTIKLNLAAYVISFLIIGYSLTSTFQVLNVLMVDIYPGKPSVATAANNLVRCEIGAVFSAVLLPLANAIGWGWSYTLLALLFVSFAPMLLVLMAKGPGWRKARKEKDEKASEAKREKAEAREALAARNNTKN